MVCDISHFHGLLFYSHLASQRSVVISFSLLSVRITLQQLRSQSQREQPSQSTFFGSCFTATQERAGLLVKYFSYTPLNAPKSAISARKHVVFTTLSKLDPASSRTAAMLAITCSVCPSIVVASTLPVAGLIGICPEA